MRLYADPSVLRTRQIAADLAVLAWVALWWWVGGVVHDGIEALTGPTESVSAGARDLSDSLGSAGSVLDGAPLVGDEVAAPFESAAGASDRMAEAGDSSTAAIERAALYVGGLVTLVPVVLVARRWLPWRLSYLREAGAAQRLLVGDPDLELFAWRAVAHQPLHRLARVSEDPVGALRRDETATVAALAQLELDALGLRAPAGR